MFVGILSGCMREWDLKERNKDIQTESQAGKGNADWNYSAPHGAGRSHSRSEAKHLFTVEEYQKTMEDAGIYTTSVNWSTLDECPMAYKGMDEIVQKEQ